MKSDPREGRLQGSRTFTAMVHLLVVGQIWVLAVSPLLAWSSEGHRVLSRGAVHLLQDKLPASFQAQLPLLVEFSVLPDFMRPDELRELRDKEAPEHYFDLELLQGRDLPITRSGYMRLLAELAEKPRSGIRRNWKVADVGTLPYAVIEETQRLAVAIALARARPDHNELMVAAMHQAGTAFHYAQDLVQPLHTTIHHDGRARPDGSSPYTGFHHLVDGVVTVYDFQPRFLLAGVKASAFEDLRAAVLETMSESHLLVDRIYALEPAFRKLDESGESTPLLRSMAEDRYTAGTWLTANLFLTAWALSEKMALPDWWTSDSYDKTSAGSIKLPDPLRVGRIERLSHCCGGHDMSRLPQSEQDGG